MKYIILPILKFIWALILSILFSLLLPFVFTIEFLWDFKRKNKQYLRYWYDADYLNYSPYFNEDGVKYGCYFKSYYHYIWNIK